MTLSHRFIFGATVTMVAPLSLATYFTIVKLGGCPLRVSEWSAHGLLPSALAVPI